MLQIDTSTILTDLVGRVVINALVFFFLTGHITAQQLQAVVFDSTTQRPISDVYIFIDDSSIGTTSDIDGQFALDLKGNKHVTLVLSHLGYDVVSIVLREKDIRQDTFYLTPIAIDISEVNITGKKNEKLRKKRMKKFINAFLGPPEERKQVRILNPETLLFYEEDKKLFATANEALKIENKRLGYDLIFILKEFELDTNDDVKYKGKVSFTPIAVKGKKLAKLKRNRQKTYERSHRSFFSKLIDQQLSEDDFHIGHSLLNHYREFVAFRPVQLDSLIVREIDENKFEIQIENYLTVRYKKIRKGNLPGSQGMSGRFSGRRVKQVKEAPVDSPTSYITSTSDRIMVDRNGRILNPLDLEEYGYWATKRIGAMLPFDYSPKTK